MKPLLCILLLSSAICVVYGLCNTCGNNGAACVSNTQFRVCLNGLPTGSTYDCPANTICADGNLCVPVGAFPASCASCGLCNSGNSFACTGYATFALCHGTATPGSQNYTCGGSLVCNIDSPQVCVDPLDVGVGGTCPLETTTSSTSTTTSAPATTTPNPSTSPDDWCAWRRTSGRFEVASDPTCRSYVYCVLYDGAWRGGLYECVGQTLFHSSTGLCQVGTPERCAAAG